MEELFGLIEQTVLDALDTFDPAAKIYLEEIAMAREFGEAGKPQEPGNFFYVDVGPQIFSTHDMDLTECEILVDIMAHRTGESRKEYRMLAVQLDRLFRPVFRFGNRAITVQAAKTPIVAGFLHYNFTLVFYPDEMVVDEGGNMAGKLVIKPH